MWKSLELVPNLTGFKCSNSIFKSLLLSPCLKSIFSFARVQLIMTIHPFLSFFHLNSLEVQARVLSAVKRLKVASRRFPEFKWYVPGSMHWGSFSVGLLVVRTLLVGAYIRVPDFWTLPPFPIDKYWDAQSRPKEASGWALKYWGVVVPLPPESPCLDAQLT